MKKRVFTVLLGFILALAVCIGMTACGGDDEQADADKAKAEQEEQQEPDEGEDFEELQQIEEQEEAMIEAEENAEETPIKTDAKYEDFVGTWKTVTSNADDAFGGYQITFRENKTFKAVITGEEETGNCTFENGVTTVQNEVVNDQFWFNEDGTLVVSSESGALAMLKKVK